MDHDLWMVPNLDGNGQHKLEWGEVIKNKGDMKLRAKEVDRSKYIILHKTIKESIKNIWQIFSSRSSSRLLINLDDRQDMP